MTETEIRESAAIFDFDGTLVDSFTPRTRTLRKVSAFLLGHLERRASEDDLNRMFDILSRTDIEMHQNKIYDRDLWWRKALKRYSGKPMLLSESTFMQASILYWESIKKRTKVYPGAKNMLRSLKQTGMKLGLISDTDGLRKMKTERIKASSLADLFDAIVVAGEETTHVKPDPEPYLLILDRLGVAASGCVSIGDNPTTDVDGALRAGMKVIIIRSKHTFQTDRSQRYYLIDRHKLTQFIINTLKSGSGFARV